MASINYLDSDISIGTNEVVRFNE